VLNDIQAKSGAYYKNRQILNSNVLHENKSIEDIASDIPANYQFDRWNAYNSDDDYNKLSEAQIINNKIERANVFQQSYDNNVRGLEADKQIKVNAAKNAIDTERNGLSTTIERLKAEIATCENGLTGLDAKLKDKVKIAKSEYNTAKAVLDNDPNMNSEYADVEPVDTSEIQAVIDNAKTMVKHLNEYKRMQTMEVRVDEMQERSDELTRKIELARELPSTILKTATIPVEGLTVVDGVPFVKGRPLSNLSDGEKLDLCVDVTISKTGQLKLILLDGVQDLDTKSKEAIYAKCKAKGVQIIATRTTDDEVLTVVKL
jgi:hypothetical protein